MMDRTTMQTIADRARCAGDDDVLALLAHVEELTRERDALRAARPQTTGAPQPGAEGTVEKRRAVDCRGTPYDVTVSSCVVVHGGVSHVLWRILCPTAPILTPREHHVWGEQAATSTEALETWARPSLHVLAPGEKTAAERLDAAHARIRALKAALQVYTPVCSDCGDRGVWSEHQPDVYDAVRQCDDCRKNDPRDCDHEMPHADVIRTLDAPEDE